MAKKFIQTSIKRPGALRSALNTPAGKNIPAAKAKKAEKKPGLVGQEARFYENVLKPAAAKRKKKG